MPATSPYEQQPVDNDNESDALAGVIEQTKTNIIQSIRLLSPHKSKEELKMKGMRDEIEHLRQEMDNLRREMNHMREEKDRLKRDVASLLESRRRYRECFQL